MASQRLAWIEVASRYADSLGDEIGQEAGPNAGRDEMPLDSAVLERRCADELVDLLHLEDVALHAGDLRDAGDLALAVGEPRELDDDAYRCSDLTTDAGDGHRQP